MFHFSKILFGGRNIFGISNFSERDCSQRETKNRAQNSHFVWRGISAKLFSISQFFQSLYLKTEKQRWFPIIFSLSSCMHKLFSLICEFFCIAEFCFFRLSRAIFSLEFRK